MGTTSSKSKIKPRIKTKSPVPVARLIQPRQEIKTSALVAAEQDIQFLINSFNFEPKVCAYWNQVIVKQWDVETVPPPTIFDMCHLETEHFARASEIMMSCATSLEKIHWFIFGLRWGKALALPSNFLFIPSSDAKRIMKRVCLAKNLELFGVSELISEFNHPIVIQPIQNIQ